MDEPVANQEQSPYCVCACLCTKCLDQKDAGTMGKTALVCISPLDTKGTAPDARLMLHVESCGFHISKTPVTAPASGRTQPGLQDCRGTTILGDSPSQGAASRKTRELSDAVCAYPAQHETKCGNWQSERVWVISPRQSIEKRRSSHSKGNMCRFQSLWIGSNNSI